MKKIIFAGLFIAMLFALSCEKEITIVQKPYENKLSIQCLITPGSVPKLYLNHTTPFLDPPSTSRQLFVNDASVSIKHENNINVMQPDSSFDKFYGSYTNFYKGNEKILSNTTYTLEIIYHGVSYSATATTDLSFVQIDSITYIEQFKDIYGDHEGVVFHFKDPLGKGNNYRYEMHRLVDSTTYGINKIKSPFLKGNDKAFVTEIGRSLYSDDGFDGRNYSFVIEPVFKHKAEDSTYVFLQTCDKNVYDFFNELDKQKLTQKNPFVEPVFLRPAQFKNSIGVFGSYALSDSVLFVYPE
jgi:hypothetical protein